MLHNKFIITTSSHMRLGVVHLHRDLLLPADTCAGGGFWSIDYVSNRLLLEGRSYDYGEPQWGILNRLFVPKQYRGMSIVYKGYGDYSDFDVSGKLSIIYY
ncbi:MAG: hypothetical protein ACI4AH_01255 [Muribaculaceae bacterium]